MAGSCCFLNVVWGRIMVESEYHFPKFGACLGYNLGSGKHFYFFL
jgi:hypothetical protein